MDSLIQYFTTNIGTDKVWTAFLVLAIYYIVKKEPLKVLAHFAERRDKEFEIARTLLESERLGKEGNDFLREHLERFAFRRYYGIVAETAMRSALLKFHEKHQTDIGWHELRRAYPHISLSDSKLAATLTLLDHVLRWVITAMCGLIGVYSLFIIGYAVIVVGAANKGQFFALTIAAVLLLIATMFFWSGNWPYHSTRKVIALLAGDGD